MEKGGTDDTIGIPVAFIETAWRRYTKHSRNKAQEIQGAVLPLVTTHRNSAPFSGAILAGNFAPGALEQLRSQGFSVLHFPYETVIEAFRIGGIDAASEEGTSTSDLEEKVRAWDASTDAERERIARALVQIDSEEVQLFMRALESVVVRQVELVRVIPLHGSEVRWASVEDAIKSIEAYDENTKANPFIKYEIEVRYKNGDRIDGQLNSKQSAVQFLLAYVPPKPSETTELP